MLDIIRQDIARFISEVPNEEPTDEAGLLRFETMKYRTDHEGDFTLSQALNYSNQVKMMILPDLLEVQAKGDIIWMQPYAERTPSGFKVWITGVLRPR
jgi:hypothetical protein